MTEIHPASMLALMFLLHFFADFNLQIGAGLDKFKQKKWWSGQIPKNMKEPYRFSMWDRYKHDYKCAMVCHALYWSLIVSLPLVTVCDGSYVINALTQGACHYYIDDMKANKKTLNLIEDQIVHAIQILFIWGAWMIAR